MVESLKAGSYTGIVESFKSKSLKGGKFFGMLPPIGLTGVFVFYSIVIGWILKYFFLSLTGSINTIDTTTYFSNFAGTPNTIFLVCPSNNINFNNSFFRNRPWYRKIKQNSYATTSF